MGSLRRDLLTALCSQVAALAHGEQGLALFTKAHPAYNHFQKLCSLGNPCLPQKTMLFTESFSQTEPFPVAF